MGAGAGKGLWWQSNLIWKQIRFETRFCMLRVVDWIEGDTVSQSIAHSGEWRISGFCRVHGAGCMVHGAWCMVHGVGCWLQVAGYRLQVAGCRVQGAGCRVQDAGCGVQGAGCRVQGVGCRVQGAGCRVQGAGYLPCSTRFGECPTATRTESITCGC